jgi:type IV pilus assembly protein PilP
MMSSAGKIILIAILVVAICGLSSCGDSTPPAPKPQVVKKKIGEQQGKKVESAASTGQSEAIAKAKAIVSNDETKEAAAEKNKPEAMSKLVEESMAVAGSYDAKGRFDPFEPLFKNDQGKSLTASKGRRRRIPQTPLERVAISQLKLSAIMRSNEGNSAIVEDATGKGYIIRKGTYIGLNSGQVTQINRSSVMIEEEVEDVSGEFRMQNIELKLQKPAGEL